MKKITIAVALLLVFVAYSFFVRKQQAIVQTLPAKNTSEKNKNTQQPSSSSQTYTDGEYTGDVSDAYYGNLQVKAIITDGKIADVQFLQYPNDRGTSIDISNRSMPLLKQEAITLQKAEVDVVSGATQTSQAFVESLNSALKQAR